MTATAHRGDSDERLLAEALAVVRGARERAPTDFLVAIAVFLGLLAAVLLVVGALVGGAVRDLCFNLGSEVLGAWLTVVLIDGLWKRNETDAAERLRTMEARLSARRDRGGRLSEAERSEWRAFVAEYHDLTRRDSVADRLRATRDYGRRARDLEARGERVLRTYDLAPSPGPSSAIE